MCDCGEGGGRGCTEKEVGGDEVRGRGDKGRGGCEGEQVGDERRKVDVGGEGEGEFEVDWSGEEMCG